MNLNSNGVEQLPEVEQNSNAKSWFSFQFLNVCSFASAVRNTRIITFLRPPTAKDDLNEYAIMYGAVPIIISIVIAFFLFNQLEGWINGKIRPGKARTATKFLFTIAFFIGATALSVEISLMVRYAETGK